MFVHYFQISMFNVFVHCFLTHWHLQQTQRERETESHISSWACWLLRCSLGIRDIREPQKQIILPRLSFFFFRRCWSGVWRHEDPILAVCCWISHVHTDQLNRRQSIRTLNEILIFWLKLYAEFLTRENQSLLFIFIPSIFLHWFKLNNEAVYMESRTTTTRTKKYI